MELFKIKTNVCPTCGAIPTNDTRKSNDFGIIETREFSCGLKLVSPEYGGIQTEQVCRSSAEFKSLLSKRQNATEQLFDFVAALDVDEEFRQQLVKHFDWQTYANINYCDEFNQPKDAQGCEKYQIQSGQSSNAIRSCEPVL